MNARTELQPVNDMTNAQSAGVGGSNPEVDVEILASVPKAFCVEDEKTANWLVKRVVAAREYAERVKAWADQELRRADREERTLMYLFGRQIEAWTRCEIAKLNGKRKSLNLPAGAVGFRTINPAVQVDDETAVITWAKEHCPAAVVTVTNQKLVRAELKSHFERTGEIPEGGAHVDPGGERFFLR